ncbi:DUF1116 domain-containing protein [Rhodococcus sp. 2.95]
MLQADPVLIDVTPALDALPGMTRHTILTSGAPLPWPAYEGGQRRAILGAALFEGLANSVEEADALLHAGDILVRPCHDYGCVGSLTGVTTASMPVLVVEDSMSGSRGHCVLYEGSARERLTYGVWNEAVHQQLTWIKDVLGPALSAALRHNGGLHTSPIIRRALGMGDDLHSRNTAATAVFFEQICESVLEANGFTAATRDVLNFLSRNDLFFLHVAMATGKSVATTASDTPHSSIVTAMALSGKEFAIRTAGTGQRWFRAPIPTLQAKYFDGITAEDTAYMGGESLITETVGARRPFSGGSLFAPGLQRRISAEHGRNDGGNVRHYSHRAPPVEDSVSRVSWRSVRNRRGTCGFHRDHSTYPHGCRPA